MPLLIRATRSSGRSTSSAWTRRGSTGWLVGAMNASSETDPDGTGWVEAEGVWALAQSPRAAAKTSNMNTDRKRVRPICVGITYAPVRVSDRKCVFETLLL